MNNEIVAKFVFAAVGLIAGFTVHEFAHGYAAYRLGDDTAARPGRLTLNPVAHIDLFGTILLPVGLLLAQAPLVFGWARPIPVDTTNLRQPRRHMAIVAAAGPLANFAAAVLFGVLDRATFRLTQRLWLHDALQICAQTNILLGTFNLIPVLPLDGGKIAVNLLPQRWARRYPRLSRSSPATAISFLVGLIVLGWAIAELRRHL